MDVVGTAGRSLSPPPLSERQDIESEMAYGAEPLVFFSFLPFFSLTMKRRGRKKPEGRTGAKAETTFYGLTSDVERRIGSLRLRVWKPRRVCTMPMQVHSIARFLLGLGLVPTTFLSYHSSSLPV